MNRYYVEDHCIACDACILEAPQFFSMNEQKECAYVTGQPLDDQEEKLCSNAKDICPVEAIVLLPLNIENFF